MRLTAGVTLVIVVGTVVATVAQGGTSAWAKQADRVCSVWDAKAKKVLGTMPPKTSAKAYNFAVKVAALETGELAALKKIPHPTTAGAKALHATQADIAEVKAAIHDWRVGKRAALAKVYTAWVSDRRADNAFIAAGARGCS